MKLNATNGSAAKQINATATLALIASCRRPRIRIVLPTSLPALNPAHRKYLRELRAAEMAVWQASGGDYVRSNALNPLTRGAAA